MKITRLKTRDLEAVSGNLSNFYSNLYYAIKAIGEKSDFETQMEEIRTIPLFKEAEAKGYLTFTGITPRNKEYDGNGGYKDTGGTDMSFSKNRMNYKEWLTKWVALQNADKRKPGWSRNVANAIEKLLTIAQKNDGGSMETSINVRIKSKDGVDSLDVSIVHHRENNFLRKLFTDNYYSNKPEEIQFKYGKGVFEDSEKMNLQKFGLSILKSVTRQNGSVGGMSYYQNRYTSDSGKNANAEEDDRVTKSKMFKKGITPK